MTGSKDAGRAGSALKEFEAEIARDGRWWMVHIPEIDGLTQARRLNEVETMAREYIALDQNIPYDEIKVVTRQTPGWV